MKAYTNIEQSKTLAKILPVESADMKFPYFGDGQYGSTAVFGEPIEFSGGKDVPCWSLAALLDQLDDVIYDNDGYEYKLEIIKEGVQYYLVYEGMLDAACYETSLYDDLINACVEMILKLHEQKLI